MKATRRLDIQTRIIFVLVAVIVPTFLVVTVLENKIARPLLQGEMKALGISTAEALATKVESTRWLQRPDGEALIQAEIQETIYAQPSLKRLDVYARDAATGQFRQIASSVEGDVSTPNLERLDKVLAEFKRDEDGVGYWDILVPIQREGRRPPKVLGAVHLVVSTHTVSRMLGAFWRITGAAAIVSIVVTIFMLNFFLRKTISNERLLRRAEDQNLQLSEQLHEAQRQLMNVEKLAVMGQLTANFAHEIGTPLNAISGHLQLLGDEVPEKPRNRLSILNGEVSRIEQIVKGFLQTTAKPVSQRQLVDVNALIDKTMGLVRPRLDALGVELRCELDRTMGPLRVVPLDIEQILLNLVNNSLDSLSTKRQSDERRSLKLEISTRVVREDGEDRAEISVHDSGMGIPKSDLRNVLKPFFTTKRPGEGTGLGLTICQQLASKYGGVLDIDAKEGAWARVKLTLPYRNLKDA